MQIEGNNLICHISIWSTATTTTSKANELLGLTKYLLVNNKFEERFDGFGEDVSV